MTMEPVIVDGEGLALEDIESVATGGRKAALNEAARARILASRRVVEQALAENRKVYGVTTGLGHLSEVRIDEVQSAMLQNNMVRSHSAGVGEEYPAETCRAMMLLRANTLAKGYSGVRMCIVENLLALLNAGIIPIIPQQGSVGASGDLVPLAHMALLLTGQGAARKDGKRIEGPEALKMARLSPIELGPKETLALVNGTQAMAAVGVLTLLKAERLARISDIAGALSLEALRGTAAAFDERIHRVRPVPGQEAVAENMRRLLAGSATAAPDKNPRIQDAYSLRCIPQVHGAIREILGFVRRMLEIEVNAATDNPLIFAEDGAVLSGGNFHGEPIAVSMDFLAIGLTELANISDRRTARLIDPHLSGLPSSLSEHAALGCSFGILQIVTASLASENRALAHPASVDNIPTAANQEDHVSMGGVAARKARDIATNLQNVLAIECLCAAQGVDFVGVDKCGTGTRRAHQVLRTVVPWLSGDRARIFHDDIAAVSGLLEDGRLLNGVEAAVGALR
jgi:histidine ammonia-lyase